MKKFKDGAVVRLNSGGPKMTVVRTDSGIVRCVWFDKDQKLLGDDFYDSALTLDDEFKG